MELIDVLDENGKVTGRVEDRKTIHEQGLWHTHVGVWIMNKNGELLFQKRAATKQSNPNMWSRKEVMQIVEKRHYKQFKEKLLKK